MTSTDSADARLGEASSALANKGTELTLEEIDDSISSLKLRTGASRSQATEPAVRIADQNKADLRQASGREKARTKDRDVHHLDASATSTIYARASEPTRAEQPAGFGVEDAAGPVAREDPTNTSATAKANRTGGKLGLQNRDLEALIAQEATPSRTSSPGVLSTGSRRVSSLVSIPTHP